jgi:hypothetical protein
MEQVMENAIPIWALPFWTMGVPLIWAIVEKVRTPSHLAHGQQQPTRSFTPPGSALPARA